MANFKFVINEPETKKSYQIEVDQGKAAGLIGKKIGEEFSGDIIGLSGYTLKITGGTDRDGFPMLPNLTGAVKKRVLLIGTPGFHPKLKGQRKRKTVRGNTISPDITQINIKVMKRGEKPLEEMVPSKPKEAKKEEPKEEKREQAKQEEKPKEEQRKETKEEGKKETKGEQKREEEAGPKEKKTEGEKVEGEKVKLEKSGEKQKESGGEKAPETKTG